MLFSIRIAVKAKYPIFKIIYDSKSIVNDIMFPKMYKFNKIILN